MVEKRRLFLAFASLLHHPKVMCPHTQGPTHFCWPAFVFIRLLPAILSHTHWIIESFRLEKSLKITKSSYQSVFPKPLLLHGLVMTQVQHLAFSLVECHATGSSQLTFPIQIPQQSLPTLKQFSTPAQLVSSADLPRVPSIPFSILLMSVFNTNGHILIPGEQSLSFYICFCIPMFIFTLCNSELNFKVTVFEIPLEDLIISPSKISQHVLGGVQICSTYSI